MNRTGAAPRHTKRKTHAVIELSPEVEARIQELVEAEVTRRMAALRRAFLQAARCAGADPGEDGPGENG